MARLRCRADHRVAAARGARDAVATNTFIPDRQ
jgi:hypothetical protein